MERKSLELEPRSAAISNGNRNPNEKEVTGGVSLAAPGAWPPAILTTELWALVMMYWPLGLTEAGRVPLRLIHAFSRRVSYLEGTPAAAEIEAHKSSTA